MNFKKYIPYFIAISLFLADVVMILGLFKLFGYDTTLIAGFIGFTGALIGGGITYLGVRQTLQHRDKEIFLSNCTEKLMINEEMINSHGDYLTALFFLENFVIDADVCQRKVLEIGKSIHQLLVTDNSKIYKCMDYDAIQILDFHKKGLSSLCRHKTLNKRQTDDCIKKIREIYNVLLVNKKNLEKKYYRYKNS